MEYISKIELTCGDRQTYVVTLKQKKKEEAYKKVLGKCRIYRTVKGLLEDGEYKEKDVTIIYKTGKLVLRWFQRREDVEDYLKELLE